MSIISRFWNQESSSSRSALPSLGNIQLDASHTTSTPRKKSPGATLSTSSSSRNPKAQSDTTHSLLAVNRYESDIQRRFQALLDVQTERLLAVTGDGGLDAQSTSDVASSSGASQRTSEYGKVIPVRQPAPQRLSLRATRREIGTALKELAAVKEQERQIYAAEVRRREENASRIAAWEERREGLKNEIQSIQSSESQLRVQDLQDESENLQEQINALENQLMELKGQQNAVKLELSQLQNSVQSKLSSYHESLRILEGEVQEFLSQSMSTIPGLRTEETSYQSLPPSRRTLELASDHNQQDIRILKDRFQSSKAEGEATEEGQVVWHDVVLVVTELEKHMRQHMSKILRQHAIPPDTPYQNAQPSLSSLVENIDRVIIDLDSKLRLSEARGWNLLVCCIGAELEALRKGRTMLADAVATSDLDNDTKDSISPSYFNDSSSNSNTSRIAAPSQSDAEIDNEHQYKVPLGSSRVSIAQMRHGTVDPQAAESAKTSPTRRSGESMLRRSSQAETKNLHIKKESHAPSSSPPARLSESAEEPYIRRSIDSFRRRNDRNTARTYRPEDDEPAPDLLITEPDINDAEE